jgi:hypothetical protein
MSTHEPTNPQYELTAWVVLATDGLVAPARERIKREIEAHYADAVAAHVAAGLPPAEAAARALDELGDIKVAARGFRRRYLTEQEEADLREFEAQWHQGVLNLKRRRVLAGVIGGASGLLLCAVMLGFWRLRPKDLDAFELRVIYAWWILIGMVLSLFFAVVLKACKLVLHHPSGVELRRKLLLLGVVQSRLGLLGCLASPMLFCTQKFFFHPVCAGVGALLLIAISLPFNRRFRLLRKLRYAQIAADPGVAA